MFRRLGIAAAVALVASGLTVQPGAADVILPVITTIERVGPGSLVAGSGQTTTFKVTSTNPNDFPIEGVFIAVGENMVVTDYSSPGATGCDRQVEVDAEAVICYLTTPTSPSLSSPLPANDSVVTTVTVKVEPWVTVSPVKFCALTLVTVGSRPASAPEPSICDQLESVYGNYPYSSYDDTTLDVTRVADLKLTATDSGQVNPGADAEVSFNVVDNGPSWAYPLTVTFTLPAGLTYKSASPEWLCTTKGQDVTCTVQPLQRAVRAAVKAPPLVVSVGTPKPGTVASYEIPATATSTATDPSPADAKATARIDVTPVVYSLSKEASGRPYRVAEKVDWALTLTNTAAFDDAGSITVVDTLPKLLVFKKSIGSGWDCSAAKQKVTCSHAGLAAGASSAVTLRTKMVSRGVVENVASLSTQSFAAGDVKASRKIAVFRSPQSAAALPGSPRRIKSGKTEQGRKLRTRVVCRPAAVGAAGEVAYCRVSRAKGVVKVKVLGSQPVRVLVVQTARGTNKYRPFLQKKIYTVAP